MPTTIAVDLAKSVFEVAVSDRPGRVRTHHRLSRTQFSRFVSECRPATILMEAGAFPICDIRGWTSFPRCATTTLGWMRLEGFAASG